MWSCPARFLFNFCLILLYIYRNKLKRTKVKKLDKKPIFTFITIIFYLEDSLGIFRQIFLSNGNAALAQSVRQTTLAQAHLGLIPLPLNSSGLLLLNVFSDAPNVESRLWPQASFCPSQKNFCVKCSSIRSISSFLSL
jgi:hypothetical protein